ncbi:DegT/DnrJ/EryC1/StrS family aminotransferase [Longispora albida]|uniref:DegT/DnrJ/EryC1/StrS family aminotransferase n=1 Tax=Longispora albida TaxID=203523 RepID=UPI00039F28DF|nr:DegT/DnrJ/EryC1/StrS family aminotransferase [Longispora albida]
MSELVPFLDLYPMTAEVRPAVRYGWDRLLESGQFVGGPSVEHFEQAWASYCGTTEAVGVGNGTDALLLTLIGLGIGRGAEVVVPASTFIATAEAVVLAGATPRFADVSPKTLLLTPETLRAAITPRTQAVIVVHLYGQMPDMTALSRVAHDHGLAVIEDAAQAHGASWHGARAGSIGQAGCFSFYPGKNLGAFGDAGAVVTSDPELAARIRSLREHGRVAGSHYVHGLLGMNSRLDAIQAEVLSAKLPLLDAWAASRREIAGWYRDAFEYTPVRMVEETAGGAGAYHLAVVRVPHRDRVQRKLAEAGVQTGVHYPVPCHLQEPFQRYATGPLPVAEHAAREVLSLPMFPHLAADTVARVCKQLREVLGAEGDESHD